MAYEKRDMTFSLFKNETKTQDTHSDYKGWIMIGGKEHWLDGWIKDGAKGRFVSGKIGKPRDGKAPPQPAASKPTRDDMDDIIPF